MGTHRDPETLCEDAADVTVWRRVPPPRKPPLRRWTTRILLTGSAAMRRTPPFVREELKWIAGELAPLNLDPVQLADIQPDLGRLLTEHCPGAFHLVAHGTSRGITFQAQPGPTPDELQIAPAFLGRALEESAVWVASFNCCDSATPATSQIRPVAYQIAERSGAVTIGMAGLIRPYPGARFAQTFYHWLGRGCSSWRLITWASGLFAPIPSTRPCGAFRLCTQMRPRSSVSCQRRGQDPTWTGANPRSSHCAWR